VLQLWEAATGREIRRIEGRPLSFFSVAFAPDGKMLASSGNATLQLWDAATGREIRRIPGLKGLIEQVAFAPDGKTFAAGDEKGAHLWDSATGTEIFRFPAIKKGPIDSLCFGPEGKTIALRGGNGVNVWNFETNREITWQVEPEEAIALSPGGKTLAMGDRLGRIRLFHFKEGETRQVAPKPKQSYEYPESIHAVVFTPDGKTLISGGEDKLVILRDPVTGAERRRLEGHIGSVISIAIAADGKTIASGSEDGTALIWDLMTVGKE
jgi:WD40 repeat protein